jgi:bla regulator protein BlaR1
VSMRFSRLTDRMSFRGQLLLTAIGTASVAVFLVVGFVNPPGVSAQSSNADWEKAAGGSMAFEVASVKPNKSDGPWSSNVGLTEDGNSSSSGGRFSAVRVPLNIYIAFAYKIAPRQSLLLRSVLPKWALTERFDIEAKAPVANPTKDQMRLMVQSLLLDRFKLATHWDSRDAPVYALVLSTPGKTGPTLRPHSAGPPCDTAPDAGAQKPIAADFPPSCGALAPLPSSATGRKRFGVRNVNMEQIVGYLQALGALNREVLDKTGLSGTFDFSIEWTPEFNGPSQPNESNGRPPNFQSDATGPTFLEALKDQLGMKLDSTTGPVQTLVIEHIEEPSEN